MDKEKKAQETQLRREAVNLGYVFIKSFRRHPVTRDRFNYWLISWQSKKAHMFEHLYEIQEFLEKEDS